MKTFSVFLFTTENLKASNTSGLKSSCKNLEKMLKNDCISHKDVDDLSNRLELLQKDLSVENNIANGILKFLKMIKTYPIFLSNIHNIIDSSHYS